MRAEEKLSWSHKNSPPSGLPKSARRRIETFQSSPSQTDNNVWNNNVLPQMRERRELMPEQWSANANEEKKFCVFCLVRTNTCCCWTLANFLLSPKKMYTHSRGYIHIRRRKYWMVEVRRHACVKRLRIHCLTRSLEHWGTRSLIICKFSSAKTVSRWQLVLIKFVIRETLNHHRRVWWCVNRQLSLIEKNRIWFFCKIENC